MDKYRPKRPTTLDLFPQQLPQAGTQDSINNNSLGKKESWKESHSSSPHITGDLTPPDAKAKAEDKVRRGARRPAPKPPASNEANGKTNAHNAAAAADARSRLRDKQGSGVTQGSGVAQASVALRSQKRAAATGGGRGGAGRGRGGGGGMREKSVGEGRGKDGGSAAREERRTGRLCAENRGRKDDKEKNQRPAGSLRNRPGETKRPAAKLGNRGGGATGSGAGGGVKTNNPLSTQEVYLTAMVVPRTPVAPRNPEKNQEPGPVPDGPQDQEPPRAMSRSSSEGGSNRMSLSSDTEGPPPDPSLPHRINPDISEEDGEGEPTPNGPALCPAHPEDPDCARGVPDGTDSSAGAARTIPKSGTAAALNYDSVKYTLVVDEHAQLELVSLKDCYHGYHGYHQHNDDSDTETVYQSANEDEDPDYEEERRRAESKSKERREEEEEARRRREEDVRRRREEEVKRRRDVVAKICRQSKATSATTAQEEESNGGRGGAPRTRKFLNLFANSISQYSTTGAGSFGVFSCVLDGVERQQSHRAVYRFVPRHADELHLESDDPILLLKQSEDLWCQGYNMRTGATGIFPAFYVVKLAKETNQAQKDGCTEKFLVRFLGSVQVPHHQGTDVLCSAMHKVACNRRLASQPPSACLLEVSVRGVKINVQDQCQSAHRGEQCFHFFQLKNISYCGCHPKHNKYFGFITKHPDQQRFACHVMMSDTTLHPLAESVGRAFKLYYKEHIGYSCPTEDIFIE